MENVQEEKLPFSWRCRRGTICTALRNIGNLKFMLLTTKKKRRQMVFENRVLRRNFGPKGDEAIGEWRKLHNEELNDLYCSLNIIRVIKSRRMRWAQHTNIWGRGEVHRMFWWGYRRGRDHLEDPGVDGRIILRSTGSRMVGHRLDCSG